MSARITRAEVEEAFGIFLRAHGLPKAERYDDAGGYRLDYAGGYGGYVVTRVGEDGGMAHPFGQRRRPAREMLNTLSFAIDVADVKSRQPG